MTGTLRKNRDDISFIYNKRVDKNCRLESKAFKNALYYYFFIHSLSVKKTRVGQSSTVQVHKRLDEK